MNEQIGIAPTEVVVDESLVLKPVTIADSVEMFELIDASRDHLSQYGDTTASKYPTLESMMERNRTQDEDEKRFTIRDQGQMVGFIKLTKHIGSSWEVGYWLGNGNQGKGYMARAVRALTDYGFTRLGADRIFASVHNENERSRNVLSRAEFTLEGQNPTAPLHVIYTRTPLPKS